MTPAEATQERRHAAITRSHRIDALDPRQLANFIHRLAAIVPSDVDRVLAEFDANAPRSPAGKLLHPVSFYGNCGEGELGGLVAYCTLDPLWHTTIDDGNGLAELKRVVLEHSEIRS